MIIVYQSFGMVEEKKKDGKTKNDATYCRMTHLLRCCCHGYAQKVLSCRSCTHLRHRAQNTRCGSTCASTGSARKCAARCSAFRRRDSLPGPALGPVTDDGVSDRWSAVGGGSGEDTDGLDGRSLATSISISISLSLMARAAAGGVSAETSASWCCDGGGTLIEGGKDFGMVSGSLLARTAGELGAAHLGTVGAAAADATEAGGGGAAGEASRHCARCCDHACAAWPSGPTDIQLLQALQRTRSPSYLRTSGSAVTKRGGGSLALQVGSEEPRDIEYE